MASSFDRWYSTVIIVLLAIGTTVLAVMMFFIMTDVLLRYIFKSPILGSYEIVEYMMALLIPFGVVYCAHKKGHVAVDILFDRFPKRFQGILNVITSLAVLVFFVLIAWQNILFIEESYAQKITSGVLYIPAYPFVTALAVGFVALCLVLLMDFLKYFLNR